MGNRRALYYARAAHGGNRGESYSGFGDSSSLQPVPEARLPFLLKHIMMRL